MKKIFVLILAFVSYISYGQDFDKNLTTARASYTSGNLNDARFAMEQMLSSLDITIGKEILKMLPTKLNSLTSNDKDDNVTSSNGAGLFVHRTYGMDPKSASVEVINNSPLITSINAILSMPLMGAMARNDNQKVVKVQGYKALLNKNTDTTTGKTSYDLQIPMNNTLVTLRVSDSSEDEVTGMAGNIPLAKIAQTAQ
jgi:hypothetical protein